MTKPEVKNIFVSVGSRFPMNRLIKSVEEILNKQPTLSVTAQVGESDFHSDKMRIIRWISENEFEQAVRHCDIFISHAGMGNILLATQLNKPIIIMPRLASLGEHINDHQTSTANAFMGRSLVSIANTTQELKQAISDIFSFQSIQRNSFSQENKRKLVYTIQQFIDHEKKS